MAGSYSRKKTPLSYQDREYRRIVNSGLVSSVVKMAETDLHILASYPVEDQALKLLSEGRSFIERYIEQHPGFVESLVPMPMNKEAHGVIREMLTAGIQAGVGPMAAVAGVIAEWVGRGLLAQGVDEVIVENGGDLFVARNQPCTVAVFAGESPLSGKLAVTLQPNRMPCGVCCSSGTVGHSLSLGVADAVVVVAPLTALADAAATRLGNEVGREKRSLNRTLELAAAIDGVSGIVIVSGEQLGAWGDIELVKI